MFIYLMRHAEAVPSDSWRDGDQSRPLTSSALKSVEKAALEMKRLGFSPSKILASPFLRAKQTAEVISNTIKSPLDFLPELKSGANLQAYKTVFFHHRSLDSFLIVSHMPELGVAASRLTMEASLLERGFRTGEMVGIEISESDEHMGSGKILWWRLLEDWGKVPV
jgi:phosphohistidine phosphatase